MKLTPLSISGVIVIEPEVFEDERGFFFESYNQEKLNNALNMEINFVQDNHSFSKRGVLRGLHFQIPPYEQAKLVRVIKGEIFDVAVDLREDSKTYGSWISEIISSKNKKQLWIPSGFAHGFLTLSDEAEVVYKTSNFYSRQHEKTILANDQELNISWPIKHSECLISKKDMEEGVLFKEIKH